MPQADISFSNFHLSLNNGIGHVSMAKNDGLHCERGVNLLKSFQLMHDER